MPAIHSSDVADGRPALGHVNLMIDTFLANATPDEQVTPPVLTILRTTLATCPASTTSALAAAARHHFDHWKPAPPPEGLFTVQDTGLSIAAPGLQKVLARARALYGVGSAFASLAVLEGVVRATVGLRWKGNGPMAYALADIDSDITQAIQSCKEEWGSGRVKDMGAAKRALASIGETIQSSKDDCERWDEESFPFERAEVSVQYWKI
ncbi:hypothetical protein EIP91_009246 [Steccherinum ochraceum]|uniref:Uncharacterized protein n=1 Tax=Steccherinum ochraceum TaxID=92696 RepID=A0A4R0R7B2_9APHY|nr:hypothetical protein EIP91_009246 [Steccherinum ochraceum]